MFNYIAPFTRTVGVGTVGLQYCHFVYKKAIICESVFSEAILKYKCHSKWLTHLKILLETLIRHTIKEYNTHNFTKMEYLSL